MAFSDVFELIISHTLTSVLIVSGVYLIYLKRRELRAFGVGNFLLGLNQLLLFLIPIGDRSLAWNFINGILFSFGIIAYAFFFLRTYYAERTIIYWITYGGIGVVTFIVMYFTPQIYPELIIYNVILRSFIYVYYSPIAILSIFNHIQFLRKQSLFGKEHLNYDNKLIQIVIVGQILILLSAFLDLVYPFLHTLILTFAVSSSTYAYSKLYTESKTVVGFQYINEVEQKFLNSERKYRALTDFSPVGIALFEDDTLILANKKFHEYFNGKISLKTFSFSHFQNFMTEPDFQSLKHLSQSSDNNQFLKNQIELEINFPDAPSKNILANSKVINLGDRQSCQLIFVDITKEKHLEQERENERIQAMETETIAQMAGDIAHQFNNVLASILGNVEILKFGQKTNENEDVFHDLYEGIEQAKGMVTKFLTFSKGGAPIKRWESLEDIIHQTLKVMQSGSIYHYNLEFEDNLPKIQIDANQITQVLNQILINSHQAMPIGGNIQIRVHKQKLEQDSESDLLPGNYIKVQIIDSGFGIPEDQLSYIFTPRYTTKQNSQGMGLLISKSIIERHAGRLEIVSKEGEGTIVTFYLPISDEEDFHPFEDSSQMHFQKSLKILVMEDEPSIQKILTRIFMTLGHQATITTKGEELLSFYKLKPKSQKFDIIIMDLIIENGLGGKETIAELRKMDPSVKVLVSSGYSNDPIMANFREYGFDGILAKPYTISELEHKLHQIVDK